MIPTLSSHVLLQALGERIGSALRLEDGVCGLVDSDGRETVIIEFSDVSDIIVLHCGQGVVDPRLYTELLRLNGRIEQMAGCWLFLDDYGETRLMTQQLRYLFDAEAFCDWVVAFMQKSMEVRSLL